MLVAALARRDPGVLDTPVARSDSTSNVLPLRCEASTKYDEGLSVTTAEYLDENPLQPVDLHSR